MKNFTLTLRILLALAICAACWIGCGGGDNPSGAGDDGFRGGNVVGDWLLTTYIVNSTFEGEEGYYEFDFTDSDTLEVASFRQSGEYATYTFIHNGNVWTEKTWEEDGAAWRIDGSSLSVGWSTPSGFNAIMTYKYNVSNDKLTTEWVFNPQYDNIPGTVTLTYTRVKINLDDFRRRHGL